MDDTTFDDLVRRLTLVRMSRMATLRGMAGSIPAALTAAVLAEEASAKKKRRKKKKRRRSEPDTTTLAPTTTTPPVTTTTTSTTTSTTTPPPGGTCTVAQNSCVESVTCNGKPDCVCWIRPAAIVGVDTPFCGGYGQCFDCSNDAQCQAQFGAGWVCINAIGPQCSYCEVNYNGRGCAPPCGA